MKPEDLRKGIVVTVNNEKHHPKLKGVPLVVTGISPRSGIDREWTYSISLDSLNDSENIVSPLYSQFIKFIEPISLTTELLDRIEGCIKLNNSMYRIGDLTIQGSTVNDGGTIVNKIFTLRKAWKACFNGKYIRHIESLHDLQNGYYWWSSGKDLELK